jgi:NAD-dependent deacetylase
MKPKLVILTGAGVSADSGLATFRGAGGLWEGQPVEEVATAEAWARDPALVWRFYQGRRAALLEVEPNAAHLALARLERELARVGGSVTLISQNVDDLHQRAGSRVLDMHGQLARLVCERCGVRVRDLEHLDPERFVPCDACGHARLRPDIVLFGEVPHHLEAIDRAVRAATHFLACGTSGAVWPAAGLLAQARAWSAETLVNSLEEPANLERGDRFLPGRAVDVVPRLVEEWLARWAGPSEPSDGLGR